jgi:hypothetical protein
MAKNRFRWEILAEKRRQEAKEAIIFGFFLPLAIISISILWGIYA